MFVKPHLPLLWTKKTKRLPKYYCIVSFLGKYPWIFKVNSKVLNVMQECFSKTKQKKYLLKWSILVIGCQSDWLNALKNVKTPFLSIASFKKKSYRNIIFSKKNIIQNDLTLKTWPYMSRASGVAHWQRTYLQNLKIAVAHLCFL